jgi:shikimate kinase
LNKNLVLTGMMGAGKSTIGRLLAKKLKIKFIDVDKTIERKEKKSIRRIFEDRGERYFREIEEKTTLQILKNKKAVIALGGGAFMNSEIRSRILKTCTSIWLKVNIDRLIRRYNNNRRPLLNKKKLDTDVRKIYQFRKKIYSLANFKIRCDNMTKNQIVEKILFLYEN